MSALKIGAVVRFPEGLEAATIERPRGDVSPTDGCPQVLCASVCRQAGKATAFMSYMRIV